MIVHRLCKGLGVLKFLYRIIRNFNESQYVRVVVPGRIGFWTEVVRHELCHLGFDVVYDDIDKFLHTGTGNIIVCCDENQTEISRVRRYFLNQLNVNRFIGTVIEIVSTTDSWNKDLAKEVWLDGYLTTIDAITAATEALDDVGSTTDLLGRVLISVAADIGKWDFSVIEYGVGHRLVDANPSSISKWQKCEIDCVSAVWEGKKCVHPLQLLADNRDDLFIQHVASAQMSVLFPAMEQLRLHIISQLQRSGSATPEQVGNLIVADYGELNRYCRQNHRILYKQELQHQVERIYRTIRCPLAHSESIGKEEIEFLQDMMGRYRVV
jgi:hypothetical protein